MHFAASALVLALPQFLMIHQWGPFWTVVCLGFVQLLVAFYNSHLTIESLPAGVSRTTRTRHRMVFVLLMGGIVVLTLVLAKLNDSHQYQGAVVLEQERARQAELQVRLDETLRAINASQAALTSIRDAVSAGYPREHAPRMVQTLDTVRRDLARQAEGMSDAAHASAEADSGRKR